LSRFRQNATATHFDTSRTERPPRDLLSDRPANFTAFTLAAALLLSALRLPQNLLRNVAIGLLLLLAATLVFPRLAILLERPFAFLSRRRGGVDRPSS
jgi:hypothetical protein